MKIYCLKFHCVLSWGIEELLNALWIPLPFSKQQGTWGPFFPSITLHFTPTMSTFESKESFLELMSLNNHVDFIYPPPVQVQHFQKPHLFHQYSLKSKRFRWNKKNVFPSNVSTVLISPLLAPSELGCFWCRLGWRAAVARVFTCERSVALVQSFPWIMWSAEKVERARRGKKKKKKLTLKLAALSSWGKLAGVLHEEKIVVPCERHGYIYGLHTVCLYI